MRYNFHVWRFPANIYIKLSPDFKFKLLNLSGGIKGINSILKQNIPYYALYHWFHDREFMPIDVATKLSHKFNLLQKLESNITHYKTPQSPIVVKNPKLPIIYDPYLFALVGHLLFDGCRRRKGGGEYTQKKDPDALIRFKNIVSNSIGDCIRIKGFRAYVPETIFRVIPKMFKVRNFNEIHTQLSLFIIRERKNNRLAFLLSHLIDEGTLNLSDIEFNLKNKNLLNLTRQIASSLNYECSKIRYKGTTHAFRLYINSAEKLLNDINKLSSEHPELDLTNRQKKFLKAMVERRRLNRKRGVTGKTKEEILRMLLERPMTIEELAFNLKICRGVIQRHLKRLKEKDMIKTQGKRKFAMLWSTTNTLSRDYIVKNILKYKRK